MLEKTLENPLDCKEIKPVNPKGSQPWIFTWRADAEAPTLWPPDEKSWLIGKDPDAGKDCRQEEKGTREDEMVGWHHWINGHELEQTPRDNSEGQGSLVCCSSWVCEELDMMERLNNKPRAGIWAPECYYFKSNVPARWASLRSLLEMETLRPCQAQLIRICILTRSPNNSLALGRLRTPGETGGSSRECQKNSDRSHCL